MARTRRLGKACLPAGAGRAFAAFIALAALSGMLLALSPGAYSNYVYDSDYAPPSAPAKVEMSCAFFNLPNASCSILGLAPDSSRDQILLALIRKGTPEENQDWVRYWNSRLQVGAYYEEGNDGGRQEGGPLRNAWFRVIDIYPSVLDPKDNYTYLPRQAQVNAKSNIDMVVDTAKGGDICSQSYRISGYDYELTRKIGAYSTELPILPIDRLLANGEKATLRVSLDAASLYYTSVSRKNATKYCDEFGQCVENPTCLPAVEGKSEGNISVWKEWKIKRYPDVFEYRHRIMVPKGGYAQGEVELALPSDFLTYEIRVDSQAFILSRNDLQFAIRGSRLPVLSLALKGAPARQSTLKVASFVESDANSTYHATIKYKLYVSQPDVSASDCSFVLRTPFETKTISDACESTVVKPHLSLDFVEQGGNAQVVAKVSDPLGNPIEGAKVVFTGGVSDSRVSDEDGIARITLARRESLVSVSAQVVGGEDVADAQGIVNIPGTGSPKSVFSLPLPNWIWQLAPILILMVIATAIAGVLMKRRSEWAFLFFSLLALSAYSFSQNASSGAGLQATIDACRSYDFDNAVRHFGECAEAYRIATEFESMRGTVGTLIANIAPLVVSNPDVTPYKEAYASMSKIALSLFRVAWAFNSLYLILNVFNPVRRSEAIKQFIWLIVFVIFVYASYFLIEDAITLVNVVSIWVAGPDATIALASSKLSVEFISENYEMLKLILPFLNLTYLVLLARYILVIGTILFFPFTLLLYFTSATRGFGQAALTVTFATMGLGILNSVLMLIYEILTKSADPLLSSTFSTTFFSASFLIFFGFVNALALAISFLSGILFIGQNKIGA